ncbi:MAG: DUF1559 domain-containing protein, partial [Pirellulales bacterium]
RKPPGPPKISILERGMFDFNWAVNAKRVTDGLSSTIAMGEAAHGPAWLLTEFHPEATIWTGNPPVYQNTRTSVAQPNTYGQQQIAWQAWVGSEPTFKTLVAATAGSGGFYFGSIMACTLEPMNKWPVTSSVADDQALNTCSKSQPGAPGTRPNNLNTKGGPHTTSNYRSDHPGGCNFLFADGSVHFLDETIDMLLYQQLSTCMGSEIISMPSE